MKRLAFPPLIFLLVLCWGGVKGDPVPASGQPSDSLLVISITGQFLAPDGKSIQEYDYLDPGRKYRLLPECEIHLSTIDGKKTYTAIGPGILILDSSGLVLLNGNGLKAKAEQPLLQNVTTGKGPSQDLAELPFRGIKVVARSEDGKTRLYRGGGYMN